MKAYTAKGPHKSPCDLCGVPVLPGDHMLTWAYLVLRVRRRRG